MAYKRTFICFILISLHLLTIPFSYASNSYASNKQSSLMAAVVAHDLRPEIGIPLAGYGAKERRLSKLDWMNKFKHSFLFKPSEGQRDPIRSKVMVLSKETKKLIFISLDFIGVDQRFVRNLAKKLKRYNVTIDQLFVSATHTHSGPGTLSRNPALCAIATDFYKRKNYKKILNQVAQNVIDALGQLEPAQLYHTSFEARGIQINKWRHHDKEYFDKTANLLLVKSLDGQFMGAMLNFAMHGNAMPIPDLRYSADILGAIERNLEDILDEMNDYQTERPAVLFMNGAQGDVKHKGVRGEDVMESLAYEFGQQAKQALQAKNLKTIQPHLRYTREKVFIGMPKYPLKICSPQKQQGLIGPWVRDKYKSIKKLRVNIPLYPIFPLSTYLSTAQVGDILMMSWPGEPSTSLGWQLKKIANEHSYKNAWVLGLTNDYLTYFTTKDEFYEATYDSCSSMYGYQGAQRILKYYEHQLKEL